MIPVNQFILGGSDPLLYPSEKMTNSIDEQIAFLQLNLIVLTVVVMVVEVFSMNFVNFLMLVEDVAVEVVEAVKVE